MRAIQKWPRSRESSSIGKFGGDGRARERSAGSQTTATQALTQSHEVGQDMKHLRDRVTKLETCTGSDAGSVGNDPHMNFRDAKAAFTEMGETGGNSRNLPLTAQSRVLLRQNQNFLEGLRDKTALIGGFSVWSGKAEIEKIMRDDEGSRTDSREFSVGLRPWIAWSDCNY